MSSRQILLSQMIGNSGNAKNSHCYLMVSINSVMQGFGTTSVAIQKQLVLFNGFLKEVLDKVLGLHRSYIYTYNVV